MTKKAILIALCITGAVVILGALLLSTYSRPGKNNLIDSESIEIQELAEASHKENISRALTPVEEQHKSEQANDQKIIDVDDKPLVIPPEQTDTDSSELYQWKKEHDFFPLDEEQLAFYASLSDLKLQELAEQGDVAGMREFGTRLARARGRFNEGIDWLIEAASYGSHHALIELSLIYLGGVGLDEPDELAYLAWLRVSYMLGDWEALLLSAHRVQQKLSVEEMYMVDVMAANFIGEINRRHYERTGLDISLNLRPGYKEALEQIAR